MDQLGTLDQAIDHARKLGKIKEGEKFEKLILPRPTSPFEQLFGPVDGDTQQHQQISRMLDSIAPGLAEQVKKMDLINLLAREKSLTIMPFEIRVQ